MDYGVLPEIGHINRGIYTFTNELKCRDVHYKNSH